MPADRDDRLPEGIEDAIKADLPPAFWPRIALLRAAIREALDEARSGGYDAGLATGLGDEDR